MKFTPKIITFFIVAFELFLFCSILSGRAFTLSDGDLIRGPDGIKVYIINERGYKRHILNPKVFEMYGHLKWSNIKEVDQKTLDSYITSNFYRVADDSKVFSVTEEGKKRHFNMTPKEFIGFGYSWDQIFIINEKEGNYYAADSDIKSDGKEPTSIPSSEKESLHNDQLPQFFEWVKERDMTLIRTTSKILSEMPEKIWNSATDELPLAAMAGIDYSFEELKKIPPHLIKLLQGQTIFFIDDCTMSYPSWGGVGSFIKLSQKYQKKPRDLSREAVEEIIVRIPKGILDWEGTNIPSTGRDYKFWSSDTGGNIVYPVGMVLCGGYGPVIHEFGHVVEYNGIQMYKGRDFAFGKTDEEIRELYNEFKRIFQVPEEYLQAYRENTLTEPPSGLITVYAAMSISENFADSFTSYINHPQYFRERAAKETDLAKKYEFLKNKIFLGQEYEILSISTPTPKPVSTPISTPTPTPKPVIQKCTDGTLYGQCSATKPKYCQSGNFADNCQICGCAVGGLCKQNGSCFQSGPPATWPEWLKQEREANIADVLKTEEFMQCCWESLENDDLPQFIEWAKERGINLVGIKKTEESKSDFWNLTARKMSLTAVPGIDLRFEMLKKLPEHLLNLARGQAIFFWGEDCIGYVTPVWYQEGLSQQYQKKWFNLPQDVRNNACTSIPSFLKYDTCPMPRDIFVCKGIGLEIHEFGHIVDFNGIRMEKGREFALGKTDEGISELYNEYKRVFEPTEEQHNWKRTDQPPPGMLDYGQVNSLENFAVHFDYYVNQPEKFREKAAANASLAEKYEFLKNKIFLGKEY